MANMGSHGISPHLRLNLAKLSLMSFTVVPLHNLDLPAGSRAMFGNDFVVQEVPEWVKKDSLFEHPSRHDRQSTLEAKHALVAEYEASSIGEPDPAWKGGEPRSIQEGNHEAAMLGNMALWLVQPSMSCFTVVFHAISWSIPGQVEEQPIVQHIERQNPLYCRPNDRDKRGLCARI
jgi:hypothetical protein